MASTLADELIDRRRLRRKVSFWRIAAFVILGILLLALIAFAARDSVLFVAQSDHIAKVEITGVITNDKPMLDLLNKVAEEENVKAVVLEISSPGGSTVGGEAIYEAVRDLADKKPVVTTVGTLAASAGYMIASATDQIVVRRSSIVGSIGVLFQYANVTELLDKVGVDIKTVKSAPLKAEPNPFNETSPEAVEMIDRVVQDTYNWFVDIVSERRNMSRSQTLTLADGSIFTGAQALENGLVDQIGGEDNAIDWLEKEKSIAEDLEVITYKPKRPQDGIFQNPAALVKIARFFGFNLTDSDAREIGKELQERLFLDGLVSIWQG